MAKERFNYRNADIKNCLQLPLQKPFEKPSTRERFWYDFQQKPFDYILTHYTTDYGWKNKMTKSVKKGTKKVLKAVLPESVIAVLKKLHN